MPKIIQIYPCLLKLSRKQESVTDGQTDGQTDCRYYYIPSPLSRGIIRSIVNRIVYHQSLIYYQIS